MALKGIIDAANIISKRQIKPVLSQIRSENYEQILMYLAGNNMYEFKRSSIKKALKISDNVLSNFLSRMVHLGIIESTGNKNSRTYIFTNRLYYVYFLVNSINL